MTPRRLPVLVIPLLCAGALAPATARAQGPGQTPQPSAGCAQPPLAAHRFVAAFSVGGVARSALVNVPPGRPPAAPLPLVLVFHGAGGSGPTTEANLGTTVAGNRLGYITVYPNANGKFWNLAGGGLRGDDDVVFTRALLDQLDRELCVDDSHVFATGPSNGGGFAARIACELNDRLAAVAPVAGAYGLQPACTPQRPVSVLEIHGTADETVPYNGWGPGGQGSVASFLAQWIAYDACQPAAGGWRRLSPRALLTISSCAGGTTVAHVKVVGEPHAWPGASRGDPAAPFSATRAVFEFFATQTVSPQPAASAHHPRRRRGPAGGVRAPRR